MPPFKKKNGEVVMTQIDVDARAQQLFEEYGPRAMIIAGQRARAAASQSDHVQARMWRRIEAVSEICSALAS
jgi:hypothetical protein